LIHGGIKVWIPRLHEKDHNFPNTWTRFENISPINKCIEFYNKEVCMHIVKYELLLIKGASYFENPNYENIPNNTTSQ
jgi:hypothetical protein